MEVVDKRWKIWYLKDINLKGDSDVTNTRSTTVYVFLLIILILLLAFPPNADYLFNKIVTIILLLSILLIFYKLILRNKNFILYDYLYEFLLKINIVTIEDALSPTIPLIEEIEKILTGVNRSFINEEAAKPNFTKGITFFWIRKDKLKLR